ncbi:MAG: hypothetical protein ABI947_20625 [Chloroflexota bacterium]
MPCPLYSHPPQQMPDNASIVPTQCRSNVGTGLALSADFDFIASTNYHVDVCADNAQIPDNASIVPTKFRLDVGTGLALSDVSTPPQADFHNRAANRAGEWWRALA